MMRNRFQSSCVVVVVEKSGQSDSFTHDVSIYTHTYMHNILIQYIHVPIYIMWKCLELWPTYFGIYVKIYIAQSSSSSSCDKKKNITFWHSKYYALIVFRCETTRASSSQAFYITLKLKLDFIYFVVSCVYRIYSSHYILFVHN